MRFLKIKELHKFFYLKRRDTLAVGYVIHLYLAIQTRR